MKTKSREERHAEGLASKLDSMGAIISKADLRAIKQAFERHFREVQLDTLKAVKEANIQVNDVARGSAVIRREINRVQREMNRAQQENRHHLRGAQQALSWALNTAAMSPSKAFAEVERC